MGKSKEIDGLVVGRLTVLNKIDDSRALTINKRGYKVYKQYYKCLCECGTEISIRKDHLIGPRKTFSCGCLQREAARKTGESCKLPKGVVPFNYVLHTYKKRALENKREFKLTIEEFRLLCSGDCYYCGDTASNTAFNSHDTTDTFKYNGIDRIDSTRGYTIDNVVPCCKNCNYAKRDLTQEDFFNLITKIHTKHHVH